MNLRVRASAHAEDEVPDYWITYSDLLVSLLMVFALLLFAALARVQQTASEVESVRDDLSGVLVAADSSLRGTGTRVSIDPETGVLTLDSEVLFAYGSAELRPSAAVAITDITERFIPTVLSNPAVDSMLQEIVVEGHTDTIGSYISNLSLSQARAYSVMRAMVEGSEGAPYAERLKDLIVASGKSEVRPVQLPDGSIDMARSRRIEIHFRMRNDELLRRVFEAVGGVKDP